MTDSAEATKRSRWRRRGILVPGAVVATVIIAGAAFATEPWTLFTDTVVDEALPGATGPAIPGEAQPSESSSAQTSASAEPSDAEPDSTPAPTAPAKASSTPTKSATPAPKPSPSKSQPPAGPVVIASGSFISHEHTTAGAVRILKLADGTRVLRIEGLDTSNGPDLRVWITDAPVIQGRDGWFVFDDGASVDLGPLKGNQGNQNYTLPAGVDLDELTSVSIWCQRFRVSFGAAELA